MEETNNNIEVEKINEEKIKQQYKIEGKPPKKKYKIMIFILCIILLVLAVFSTIFSLLNINNNNMIKGIEIENIDISGLSKQKAKELINTTLEKRVNKEIILKYKEYETTINSEQIEFLYNLDNAIDEAYNVGRTGNIITNNYEILGTMLFKKSITAKCEYNDTVLVSLLEAISLDIPDHMQENSYYIDDDELVITRGKEGIVVNIEQLGQEIIQEIRSETKREYLEIVVKMKTPEAIDIDKIYSEVYKEAKDAYYTTSPFTIYPHVVGLDFKITIEEAKELLKEDKEEYVIPLKLTMPSKTTNNIGAEAFPDLLSTFSTQYDASNINRSTNLKLASDKINGTVVLPGETFSYNKVVGERTIAAGYKEANIYAGGQVVPGLAGGICQISSTLYNTVLFANLEIASRKNHQFLAGYVGAGRDATVVYGSTDFSFKNTRNYPIRIVSSVKNGIAKIDIYGIKEEVEYTVEIKTTVTSSIPYTTQYIEDSSLAQGTQKVKQNGISGAKSETHKIVLLNGKVISKTLLSKDTYNMLQKVILVGMKGSQPQTPTTPNTPSEPADNTEQETPGDQGSIPDPTTPDPTIPDNSPGESGNI